MCFVEFDEFILIEKESVAIQYYISKLPVYDYNGLLMVPLNYNAENTNKYELTIEPYFSFNFV